VCACVYVCVCVCVCVRACVCVCVCVCARAQRECPGGTSTHFALRIIIYIGNYYYVYRECPGGTSTHIELLELNKRDSAPHTPPPPQSGIKAFDSSFWCIQNWAVVRARVSDAPV